MSKQFTAVAILQLVDKGLADLDTDVRTYIPEYNTHDHTITLRHLLTHTSGITSFTELDTFATLYNKDMGRRRSWICLWNLNCCSHLITTGVTAIQVSPWQE